MFPDVGRLMCDLEQSGVGGRVRQRCGEVVERGVVERYRGQAAGRSHGIRKMHAAMAHEAGERPAVEQYFAALCRVGDRAVLAVKVIPVVRRSRRHDCPFERREGPGDVVSREWLGLIREGGAKETLIRAVSLQAIEPGVRAVESQLDGVIAVHRHQRLVIEPRYRWIRPGQRPRISVTAVVKGTEVMIAKP
jgi:hypothetical protein